MTSVPFDAIPPRSATADEVIAALRMQPIPGEGGYFVLGPRVRGLSSITALLTDSPEGFSALHRLSVDEGWQWLAGAPVDLLVIDVRTGDSTWHRIGPGGAGQAVVPAGSWQGAATLGAWSLVACWCAPQFTDEVFELGVRAHLNDSFPHLAADIERMTRV
jgi:predicted cupin superfamily sugar epimerase